MDATVKSGGCGPVSMSIVIDNLFGKGTLPPEESAKFAIECGARVSGGTNMSIFVENLLKKYKMQFVALNDIDSVVSRLTDPTKCIAIANVSGDIDGVKTGIFSNGGHYIVLSQADSNSVQIIDPGLYSTKYSSAYRKKFVNVQDGLCYAVATTVDFDCKNRNPKYYLFIKE